MIHVCYFLNTMLSDLELQKRKQTIGSSEVSAICNLSPWKTRAHVLEEKFGLVQHDQGARQFRIGHKLEKPIAELAVECGDIPAVALVAGQTIFTKDGWRSATPDFYALRTGNQTSRRGRPIPKEEAFLVECKNVGIGQMDHWGWGKTLPKYVEAQVQWQMSILDHDEAVVTALVVGDVRCFPVVRNDLWIAKMTNTCRLFWERYLGPDAKCQGKSAILYERLKASSAPRRAA